MRKVMNCYFSKGSSMIDGKQINWDNVVFECVTDNYINNQNMSESPVFGGKFEKVKIARDRFAQLYQDDITKLAGHEIEIYYNSARQPIDFKVVK